MISVSLLSTKQEKVDQVRPADQLRLRIQKVDKYSQIRSEIILNI